MFSLPATVTAREAGDTLRMLEQGMRNHAGETLVVDATGLTRFDSSALAVLLEVHRLAAAWGKRFQVRNLPAKLAKLAELYGVEEFIPTPA